MRKLLVALLAALAAMATTTASTTVGVAAAPRGAPLPPDVAEALANAGPDDEIEIVVTFAGRADLSPRRAERRGERRRRVIENLQRKAEEAQAEVAAELEDDEAEGQVSEVTSLWMANAIALQAKPAVIERLARRKDIVSIQLDRIELQMIEQQPGGPTTEPNIDLVNAPQLWAARHTGQGVVVAVLDTGVNATHPDLAGSYRGGSNSWFDPYGQFATPIDQIGHGTSVAGVIVGGDAGGTAVGVAPGAQWIAAKLYDDRGQATLSAIHQAFQWALDPDGDPTTDDGADVVNGSWVIGGIGCNLTFEPDLQILRAAGVVPVFAAGNYGPGVGSSASPANNPSALAVGAVDDTLGIAGISSRGPSACGEPSTVFPELVAPGVGIRSTDRTGSWNLSTGTSIAAPHVTGALALLLSAEPGLSDTAQIDALLNGATDLGDPGPDDTFGHGLLDVAASLAWLQPPQEPSPFFADGFEAGNTWAWSTTVNFQWRLTATPAAALDGAYGLQLDIVNQRDLYVADTSPEAAGSFVGRFRFDPNSVHLPENKVQDLLLGLDGAGELAFRTQLRLSAGGYQVRVIGRNDDGRYRAAPWADLTDDPHLLEVAWSAAGPGLGDGQVSLAIDGIAATARTGLLNEATTLEELRLGAPMALHKDSAGTEYFDDFAIVSMG